MWLISPGVVLHKKLQDFTVGHAFLLDAIESPFMVGGKLGLGDLVVAALLCSKSFQDAKKYLLQPPPLLMKKAERWGWWCRLRGFNEVEEIVKFKEYIAAYTEMADPYTKPGAKTQRSAMPMAVRVAWCLMERMTEEDAWNCPMSRALTYFTAMAECGGTEFATEQELRQLKVI